MKRQKGKNEKFVSNWDEASYWVMMASEAIKRKALLEAQIDVDRLKERLEWVALEEKKSRVRGGI